MCLRVLFRIEQKGRRQPETFVLLYAKYPLQFHLHAVGFQGMNPIFCMVSEY